MDSDRRSQEHKLLAEFPPEADQPLAEDPALILISKLVLGKFRHSTYVVFHSIS